ncbi:MAG TPA: DUF952 domain-containing protein [Hyphomicrobiaceae bacterium]|nr:DUF952 domain-containing protein [Hyphomicrobiaceae bacterium]
MHLVFKICAAAEWAEAERTGEFAGSAVDRRDGYIHFSAREQVAATAALHFAGADGLVLVAVDAAALGPALKWEPARDGSLFPHLYATLAVADAVWVRPLPRDSTTGRHRLPNLETGDPMS